MESDAMGTLPAETAGGGSLGVELAGRLVLGVTWGILGALSMVLRGVAVAVTGWLCMASSSAELNMSCVPAMESSWVEPNMSGMLSIGSSSAEVNMSGMPPSGSRGVCVAGAGRGGWQASQGGDCLASRR